MEVIPPAPGSSRHTDNYINSEHFLHTAKANFQNAINAGAQFFTRITGAIPYLRRLHHPRHLIFCLFPISFSVPRLQQRSRRSWCHHPLRQRHRPPPKTDDVILPQFLDQNQESRRKHGATHSLARQRSLRSRALKLHFLSPKKKQNSFFWRNCICDKKV